MSGGGWRVRQRKKMYGKGMKTYYLLVNFIRHVSEVAQSCPTLCDLMDYTIHEILLGRVLKRVAVPFSRTVAWMLKGTGQRGRREDPGGFVLSL